MEANSPKELKISWRVSWKWLTKLLNLQLNHMDKIVKVKYKKKYIYANFHNSNWYS